jgi:DNA-binding MarR family transcriptional regulator
MGRTATPKPPTEPATAPARWLDDRERQTWLAFIFATRLFWEEIERDLQRDAQLPYGYYEILVMLSAASDRTLRMSELAEATQSSRSRLSHAVARLETAGWVRRDTCPTDRRGALAVLTDKGFAALAAAAPSHVESVRRHFFDQLSPTQQDELREVCDQLLEHLLPLATARGDVRAPRLADARAHTST